MSRIAIMELGIILITLLFILIVPTLLQIFLSSRENKYLGWILPVIFGVIGSIVFLNIAVFQDMAGMAQVMVTLLSIILSYIPAVLIILIYKLSRKKYQNKSEIEKMNIKDL